jgi:hypothetical protein
MPTLRNRAKVYERLHQIATIAEAEKSFRPQRRDCRKYEAIADQAQAAVREMRDDDQVAILHEFLRRQPGD